MERPGAAHASFQRHSLQGCPSSPCEVLVDIKADVSKMCSNFSRFFVIETIDAFLFARVLSHLPNSLEHKRARRIRDIIMDLMIFLLEHIIIYIDWKNGTEFYARQCEHFRMATLVKHTKRPTHQHTDTINHTQPRLPGRRPSSAVHHFGLCTMAFDRSGTGGRLVLRHAHSSNFIQFPLLL